MKMLPRYTAFLVAALSAITACTPIELPPPAPPPKEMPPVRTDFGSVAPGKQRVVLDTPDEQARVSEVTSHSTSITPHGYVLASEHDRPLCLTPCAVDLGLGLHELSFQSTTNDRRGSDVELQVQGDPIIVRHEMAETRTPHPAVQGVARASLILGVLGVAAGIPITMAGVFVRNDDTPHSKIVDYMEVTTETPGSKGIETAGLATLGVGAGLLLLGAITGYLARDEYTPSATTEWAVPRSDAQVSSAPSRAPNTVLSF